jgi:hypothetical protein
MPAADGEFQNAMDRAISKRQAQSNCILTWLVRIAVRESAAAEPRHVRGSLLNFAFRTVSLAACC